MKTELSDKKLTALKHATVFPQKLSYWQRLIAEHLTERIECRVDGYLPENHILDQIVDGKMTPEEFRELDIEPFNWFGDSLKAVNWWRVLAEYALQGKNSNWGDGPNPQFSKQSQTLISLLADVLSAYVPAYQNVSSAYGEDWDGGGPVLTEFLRSYRRYTRFLENFTLEVFPDLNRELLLNPDFGFKDRERIPA